jgi:hypothetical protein
VVPVPLRIDSVECKGHDYQEIGIDGIFGPGGVNFTGGHVFDIVFVADPVVGGGGIAGNAVVNDNVFGDHHPAQNDLSRLRQGLDFILRYLGRKVPEQSVHGDDDDFLRFLGGGQGVHLYGLQGQEPDTSTGS